MTEDWTRTIVIGAVIVGLLVGGMIAKVYFHVHTRPSHVTVFNRADEPIGAARLKLGDRELNFGAIDARRAHAVSETP